MLYELGQPHTEIVSAGTVADPERMLHGVDSRTFMMRSGVVASAATVAAMALTAEEMNSTDKERSEGGLAVSLVLC